MRMLRNLVAAVALGAIGTALAACASSRSVARVPLPENPEPCTKYCPVWVPPVCRKVPCLVQEGPCNVVTPTVTERVRFREECVKPREVRVCKTPDKCCEMAAVQTSPGGWKWKQDECNCWSYVYEPPCYGWCEKTVREEGIEYCVETPPEYRTVAWTERRCGTRCERGLPRFRTEWRDEVYEPGHWEWKATRICDGCVQCAPCPRPERCLTPRPTPILTHGCDPCN